MAGGKEGALVISEPSNNALKLTKRAGPLEGALRAPSSLSRASQLSAVLDGPET